jgi:hypothetical protein
VGFLSWAAGRALDYVAGHPASSPEARERIETVKAAVPIRAAALRQAASDAVDDVAAAALGAEVEDRDSAAVRAIEDLGDPRDNFLYDRAYRLLTAVVDGGPVRPIDPAMADLFAAEEELGRLPLQESFASLAQTEPRLAEVEREFGARRSEFAEENSRKKVIEAIGNRTESLVGFGARKQRWLLRSDITDAVVFRYLLAVAMEREDDLRRPLFARPGDVSRGILLWGLKRPSASN